MGLLRLLTAALGTTRK